MTTATQSTAKTRLPPVARKGGYVVAAGINAVMLYVANNLLEWGWFSWLTAEFEEVLALINISLIVSIVVNVLYVGYDARWFKSLTQIVVNIVGIWVALRMWRVFPFDFSAYEFNWGILARFAIGASIFGMSVGLIVEAVKLVRAPIGGEGH